MIQLTRTANTAIIPASLSGANRLSKNKELIEGRINVLKGTNEKIIFKSNYWKAAKPATKSDSFDKCAYCESPTAVVAHGDIEHFRPKSEYWWLAYTYHNYCFCCQICNQSYKSDNFPIFGTKWPQPSVIATTVINDILCSNLGPDPLTTTEGLAIAKYKTLHTAEKPGLPDPYFDDPEKFFAWEADDTLREVKIISKTNGAVNKRRLKAVEDYFGLNRNELKRERYGVYKAFRRFKTLAASPSLTVAERKEVRDQMDEMKLANSPYAAMCRYFDANL
jgi:Pyruvate/2-oxoacid:ferredoxin oxidoreductase delta subunit